jgi:hypothetical protein
MFREGALACGMCVDQFEGRPEEFSASEIMLTSSVASLSANSSRSTRALRSSFRATSFAFSFVIRNFGSEWLRTRASMSSGERQHACKPVRVRADNSPELKQFPQRSRNPPPVLIVFSVKEQIMAKRKPHIVQDERGQDQPT